LRFRPRISLLTALLLTAIVALAIVVAQLWHKVDPLQSEVRRLRAEVGYLSIDDPTKAYGIAVASSEENTWRWRIHLPPGTKYVLHEWSGHLPNRWPERGGIAAIEKAHGEKQGTASSGDSLTGEISVEVRFDYDEGKWLSRTIVRRRNDEAAQVSTIKSQVYQPSGDWLSDRRGRTMFSSLKDRQQKEFAPNDSILLLHLQRQVIKNLPNNVYTSTSPKGNADGVMIWLEPETKGAKAPAP